MTPYRKPDRRVFNIVVATNDPAQPYIRPSTGTRDRATALAMEQMFRHLGKRGTRTHWVIDAVVQRRLTVGAIYDAYVSGTLEALRASLDDVDLAPLALTWRAQLDAQVADGTFATETRRKYVAQVGVLVAGGVRRSHITGPTLKARLMAVPGSGTNRRHHAAAWTSFLDFCVEAGQLETNPLRALKLPKSNRVQERWAEWPHVLRLLHAMPAGLHRALAAVRHGAGMEMQAALAMTRRDVDLDTRIVWAHGRKNTYRDRQALVMDDTCWDVFAAYVRNGGFLPDALLFPIPPRAHHAAQHAACATLRAEGIPIRAGYTLHNARSSFAVEMLKRGEEPETIRRNMGLASMALLLQRYGKYRPRLEDVTRAATRRAAR